jgi:putative transposase
MNKAKCTEEDYINFIVATPVSYSSLEAGQVQAQGEQGPAHDAFSRLLQRLEPDARALWQESEPQVVKAQGILVLDDTTLDKPYTKQMDLVTWLLVRQASCGGGGHPLTDVVMDRW